MKPKASKKGLLKVTIPVEAMRVAGAWVDSGLAKNPGLDQRMQPDTIGFLRSLSKRSGTRIELTRDFAERFVMAWLKVFESTEPLLLWNPSPIDGPRAMAVVVSAIAGAIRRKPGRQPRIDPIETYVANEKHKRTRLRTGAGKPALQYAHELTADDMGVSNKGTIAEAVKHGKETVDEWRVKAAQLPNNAEVLIQLVDHAAPRGQRIKATIFATGKKIPPFTGENDE